MRAQSGQGAQAALASQQTTLSKLKGNIATLVAQKQAARQPHRPPPTGRAWPRKRQRRNKRLRSRPVPATACSRCPPCRAGAGRAVAAAESQIGVPYVWAGATPGVGFDCSGLTMWAWAHAGVSFYHSAAAQYDETVHVPLSDLQPGDLLFYMEGGIIGHVTMYVGPGQDGPG